MTQFHSQMSTPSEAAPQGPLAWIAGLSIRTKVCLLAGPRASPSWPGAC